MNYLSKTQLAVIKAMNEGYTLFQVCGSKPIFFLKHEDKKAIHLKGPTVFSLLDKGEIEVDEAKETVAFTRMLSYKIKEYK